jgi:hypothetical protein
VTRMSDTPRTSGEPTASKNSRRLSQVEPQHSSGAVNLKGILILAGDGEASGVKFSDASIVKTGLQKHRVVYFPTLGKCMRHAIQFGNAPIQKPSNVDKVSEQVAHNAGRCFRTLEAPPIDAAAGVPTLQVSGAVNPAKRPSATHWRLVAAIASVGRDSHAREPAPGGLPTKDEQGESIWQ